MIINTDIRISSVFGDNSGAVILESNRTLVLGHTISGKFVSLDTSKITLTGDGVINFGSWVKIWGTIQSNNKISLNISDELFMKPQNLAAKEINITETGKFHYNLGNDVMTLDTNKLQVDGSLSGDMTSLNNFEILRIGKEGKIQFKPTSGGERLGFDIEIHGELNLGRALSISHPCDSFVIKSGGTVSFSTNDQFKFECTSVLIDGTFAPPGRINFGEGTKDFNIGNLGNFTFTPASDLLIDNLIVHGFMHSKTQATLRGKLRDNIHFLTVGETGELMLDTQSQDKRDWNISSEIGVHTCNIHGKLFAGLLKTEVGGGGWDYLFVNDTGSMIFEPESPFLCNHIVVHGTLETIKPVILKSHNQDHPLLMTVGPQGSVYLDSSATHPNGPWNGMSLLQAEIYKSGAESVVSLGHIDIKVNNLEIGGESMLDPSAPIKVDYLHVTSTGKINISKQVNIKGLSKNDVQNITLDGWVKFDSSVDHSKRLWSNRNGSQIDFKHLNIGGHLNAGLLTVGTGWPLLNVDQKGILEFDPKDIFNVEESTIAGKLISYSSMIGGSTEYRGRKLSVLPSGIVDLNYRCQPDNDTSGCSLSVVRMQVIENGGSIRAGSMHVFADDVTVQTSGTLDVTGGGFMSSNGPGTSQCHDFDCMCVLGYCSQHDRS